MNRACGFWVEYMIQNDGRTQCTISVNECSQVAYHISGVESTKGQIGEANQ